MSTHNCEEKVVKGACPQDCPDTCAMLYTVEDGKLVDVRGNPDHPMTRGGLCIKLKDFAEHHYNPDRVLYPMKRTGPKGSGRFTRISWDEALGEIKRRWTDIIASDGAQAILPFCYLGHEGLINGLTAGDAFFNRLGSTVAEKTFCASGSSTAWIMTVGPTGGVDPESFAVSKYIILWAVNTLTTNLHHWPFIIEARKNGAKVVVIDPVRTRTAKQADWHIRPKPGTDAALALGMMNVIIGEDLVDHDYIARYTFGYDELKARAAQYPPEKVAAITGVAADDIRQLAREFATTQPSVIRLGVALERHHNGGQAIRAVTCLPALVGSWRHPGGGALEMPLWAFPLKLADVCRPDWIRPGTRVVNLTELGAALTELDPPLKSIMVYNANPMSQAPQQNKIRQGLLRDDLFTVVSELFVTDTAKYADILLPAAMQAEQLDLMFSWGHFYFTLNQKAIEPPGECVSNAELFRRLARTMGFDDDYWERSDEQMIRDFVDWSAPVMEGITYERLVEEGYAHLNVGPVDQRTPHAEGNFPTLTGKCELKTTQADNGNFVVPAWRSMYEDMQPGTPIDPVPDYLPPYESPASNPELASRYPLNIVSPKSHGFLNSQYANESIQQLRQGEQTVLIHPADAAGRGIRNGQMVRVHNDRGAFEGRAELTEDTLQGVVAASLGYWPGLSRTGTAVNCISSDRHCNLGQAPSFSDNLVEVEQVPAVAAGTPQEQAVAAA